MTAWNPIDEPVDTITLAGKVSPGIAKVEGAGQKRDWDERRGYGLTGARVVYKGTKLVRFKVTFTFTTAADFVAWDEWKPLVQRPPDGTRPRAMDIEHPLLAEKDVRSCVVEEVGQPEQSEDGTWTVSIAFIEFRPPTPALATPSASVARTTDPIDLEIEALTRQVQTLSGS